MTNEDDTSFIDWGSAVFAFMLGFFAFVFGVVLLGLMIFLPFPWSLIPIAAWPVTSIILYYKIKKAG